MFQRFMGPKGQAHHVYTDNAGEFIKAFQELGWPHDTSRPHRSETNGIAERAVRRVDEGTSCVLGQSGFTHRWWAWAMKANWFQRNVVDIF